MKRWILSLISLSALSVQAQTAGFLPAQSKGFQSPSGARETCWSPRKWVGGFADASIFSADDLKKESQLCGYDFYANVALCPKLNSTNPGTLICKIPEGKTRAEIMQGHCTEDSKLRKVEAKFKQSITCSYTPSGIATYHVSRILGGVGRIPVTVLRTMDPREHQRIAERALDLIPAGEMIGRSWNKILEAHQERPSTLFTRDGMLYGFLTDNVKNEFIYTEVSGVGGYDTRYQRFVQQAPYLRVTSPQSLEQLAGSNQLSVVVPMMVQMKDVSDMVLLDTLMSQDDRIGNIHYKFRWYWLENGVLKTEKSEAQKVTRQNQSRQNYNVGIVQAVVPESELAAAKGKQAFLVKEMVLKDNDCGVNVNMRSNNMRSVDGIENVRHMSYETYSRFMRFAQAVKSNEAQAQEYFTKDLLYTNADFKGSRISFMGNLQRAYDVLKTKCDSGQLRFDLDVQKRLRQDRSATPCEITSARGPASEASIRRLWRSTGRNPRKLLSSNVSHYWAWMKENATDHVDKQTLVEGVVIGDPHLKNILDGETESGRRQLMVADVDDGGRAPLILDFVRMMTIFKVADLDFKYRPMFEAYVEGLQGKAHEIPEDVQEALATTKTEMKEARLKYIEKNTTNGKFNHERLESKPVSKMTAAQKSELQAVLAQSAGIFQSKGWKAVDYALRVNDSGSSMGLERYWVLVEVNGKLDQVIEFKKMTKPAVEFYQDQLDAAGRIDEIRMVYGEKMSSDFQVVSAAGQDFWMRPRRANAVDLDKSPFDLWAFQKEWGLYLCNWMGQKQRRLENGRELLKLIQKNEAMKDELEALSRAYIAEVETY
ncbi:MAG: DUF2252 family protein [Bdellovibrionaceae bacterium]|nr:DUF2252 family protein [Pseudobdellovibrionaceae bacterium]